MLVSSLLFADDTMLLAESAKDMRRSLQCLQSWCEEWCMEINGEKSAIYDAHEEEKSGLMCSYIPSRVVWMRPLGFLL